MDVLGKDQWWARRDAHHDRVDRAVAEHLDRARRGIDHPVHDFLFTYYRVRPAQLRRWHPGLGVVLADGPAGLDDRTGYVPAPGGVTLDALAAFGSRRDGVAWIHRLLLATRDRPARLDCFGLHEWAMVYGLAQHEVRHPQLPLRLEPERIAAVVDEREVRCTHFDAFRFFTPPARVRNVRALTPADRLEHDQPGCLHVGMDLYKWAGKLGPAVCSDLLMDCFDLARRIRIVDMRASPYDVSELGYHPIPIETPAGRAEYATVQRDLARRAEPLRRGLIAVTSALLERLPG